MSNLFGNHIVGFSTRWLISLVKYMHIYFEMGISLFAGNAEELYDSVHSQIFSLPSDFMIYPAHDYTGR